MCDISLPIGAFFDGDLSDLIPVFPMVDIGGTDICTSITASVAVKIDSFSLMVVAYSSSTGSNLIGIVGLGG